MNSDEIRSELKATEREINSMLEVRADIMEAVRHIEADLGNTLQEFVATSGREPSEYYPWRRAAKQARLRKLQAVRGLDKRVVKAKEAHTRLQMALLSAESGYRGEEPQDLLRATYHFLMDLLSRVEVDLDDSERGLLMTVRLQCGYDVPSIQEDSDGAG